MRTEAEAMVVLERVMPSKNSFIGISIVCYTDLATSHLDAHRVPDAIANHSNADN